MTDERFPCGHTTPNSLRLVKYDDGAPAYYERCRGCVTPEQAPGRVAVTDAERDTRLAAVHAKELADGQLAWWYLAFTDGPTFRGAVILEAHGILDAIRRCHALGINPGGWVHSTRLVSQPPTKYCDRLLTAADIAVWDKELAPS